MTKHTPGPWYFHHFRGSKTRIISLKSERYGPNWDIANVISGLGESNQEQIDANARLISAAPDLLDALKEAIVWWDDRKPDYESRGEDPIEPWRMAVAKAEGKDHD